MSALLVDTSVWISYFSGSPEEGLDIALKEARVYLSPVVAAELLSGRLSSRQRKQLLDFFEELPICGLTLEHWIDVAALRAQLFRKGLSVSAPDAHIAQSAMELNAELMTTDKIFTRIAKVTPLRLI